MNISEDLNKVIKDAYLYAQKRKCEYVTPETILLVLCDNEDFICAVEECGAEVSELAMNLTGYIEQHIEKSYGTPESSAALVGALSFAAMMRLKDAI